MATTTKKTKEPKEPKETPASKIKQPEITINLLVDEIHAAKHDLNIEKHEKVLYIK